MFMERKDMQISGEMVFVITRMMLHKCIALRSNVFLSIVAGGKSFTLKNVSREMQSLNNLNWTGHNMQKMLAVIDGIMLAIARN